MPTALPWFVVFTLARYQPRNALMNVITDKRSRYAGRRYLIAAGIALSSRVSDSTYDRSHPEQANHNLPNAPSASIEETLSLSFNEHFDTKAERKIAFSVRAGATIFLFYRACEWKGKRKGERQSEFKVLLKIWIERSTKAKVLLLPARLLARASFNFFFAKQSSKQVAAYECAYPLLTATAMPTLYKMKSPICAY